MSTKKNKQLVDDMYQGLNQNILGVMQRYWKEDMVGKVRQALAR